ncbi:hypothetical protein IMZ48_13235 [Candidatus Bathyarchaeota archaeon]|nr:hypothetical protein [Candidatus Bathyarchaeota archaeon]
MWRTALVKASAALQASLSFHGASRWTSSRFAESRKSACRRNYNPIR